MVDVEKLFSVLIELLYSLIIADSQGDVMELIKGIIIIL